MSKPVVLGAVVLVALLAVGSWIFLTRSAHQSGSDTSSDDKRSKSKAKLVKRSPGFQDMAGEAGITFQTHFLPEEQGEKFKGNLYDHGCGLAVGDFDGDGLDDIYFL